MDFIADHVNTILGICAIITIALELHRYVGLAISKQIQTVHRTAQLVEYMFSNHLPHIEAALRKLCIINGLDYDDVPPPPTGLH